MPLFRINLFLTALFLQLWALSLTGQPADFIRPGAYQISEYLPALKGKKVGICTNHSGLIGKTHLVDSLLALHVEVIKVYSPEHGFRGTADAGEKVKYEKDSASFQLISLYGKNRKPTPEAMRGIEIMIFDIQDVGVRFFTYLSTMTLVMEACAEMDIPMIILDRPNPNGSYIDGPIMEKEHQSFLGMHPVPIVHGMTPGEFALMINGEGWLRDGVKCKLEVIRVQNWNHDDPYTLPVKPSPNLPDDISISWYPSLCLFEQTICSVGRGTNLAFQHIGHPQYPDQDYFFIPEAREGASSPLFEGERCYGEHYGVFGSNYNFTIQPLIDFYKKMNRPDFFKPYFHRLAGTKLLQEQIEAGMSQKEIKATWEPGLIAYRQTRRKYLLYD